MGGRGLEPLAFPLFPFVDDTGFEPVAFRTSSERSAIELIVRMKERDALTN